MQHQAQPNALLVQLKNSALLKAYLQQLHALIISIAKKEAQIHSTAHKASI